jgi:hypothetical protein
MIGALMNVARHPIRQRGASWMRLTVFEANGGIGRLVVSQALQTGHEAVAMTRHPDQFP